eukprot:gene19251-biopygen13010
MNPDLQTHPPTADWSRGCNDHCGISWTFAGSAYDSQVEFTDGTKQNLGRRERPQILVIDGEPAVLYNGVEDSDGWMNSTHTLAQRIATKADVARYEQLEIIDDKALK